MDGLDGYPSMKKVLMDGSNGFFYQIDWIWSNPLNNFSWIKMNSWIILIQSIRIHILGLTTRWNFCNFYWKHINEKYKGKQTKHFILLEFLRGANDGMFFVYVRSFINMY